MPRKIDEEETFTDLHDEIDYTLARTKDEPLAAGFVAEVETWTAPVGATETIAREITREEAGCDAARQGANQALDAAVTDFADDLYKEVAKDKAHARWRGHFRDLSVSAFNRQDFAVEVAAVRAWLRVSTDPLLEAHRAALEATTARGETALARTNALATRRTTLWQARADLAAALTERRDALHDDLSRIARANKLPRTWADSFFRKSKAPKKATP